MHRNRHRAPEPSLPKRSVAASVVRSAVIGTAAGLVVAAGALAIGALRAGVFLLGGHHAGALTAEDLAVGARLAGSFAAGGFLVGVAGPWLRLRIVRHLAFYFAGIVSMIGLSGALHDLTSPEAGLAWMLVVPLGVILGLFGVYYFERQYPAAAGLRSPADR